MTENTGTASIAGILLIESAWLGTHDIITR